ncbi:MULTISPECIES: hypothetical protein [unclassified Microcoleus]|uniref:hypothetical protein n=1 Tax=unclassified Microcoleus TaxID=2642155 RepID=UPI002FD5B097
MSKLGMGHGAWGIGHRAWVILLLQLRYCTILNKPFMNRLSCLFHKDIDFLVEQAGKPVAENGAISQFQLPITNYQLPITNYQLPITNYQLPKIAII